ncbi:MAG: xanthine dehydrogenase family protein molybdopterin-binding subunit [Spirochaetales bacterium]|nr:xanthine dehydrogenase family protein molybdopterin-binding subunit [Spirochaetales bacterium]
MHKISVPVIRNDSKEKSSGSVNYISDIDRPEMYYMSILSAKVQHAEIIEIIKLSLPENYVYIDACSFNGMNRATIVTQDWPFFAEKEILYYGQAIIAVAGPELEVCEKYCSLIDIEYKELPAISTIEESDIFFNDYNITKGTPEEAFKKADKVYEESFGTGFQEQAYMEPQGVIAEYKNGILKVEGSLQCPYYVQNSLMNAFSLEKDKVRVIQSCTGGAFGGKEDYPSIISAQAAAAAMATGHPVKIILDRHEDMASTPKRHPSLINFKTAIDQSGNITAMDIDCRLDAGAYQSLSGVVLERAIFVASGAYNIENLKIRGRTMKTNHVPSGAFRGFGGPQAIFGAEMNMYFLSKMLKVSPLALKQKYLYKKGDKSVTSGTFRDDIKFDEMLQKIEEVSGYSIKWSDYEKPQTGNKLKGIGISFAAHGGGFTGNGERDLIKAVVKVSAEKSKTKSGYKATVFVSNVEMGQGASTTLRKIVSESTGLPLEDVFFSQPDTAIVPNSGPTVASRTILIVGKLLQDASEELKQKIESKEDNITVEKRYKQPDEIKWDQNSFNGDAYPCYSWSINVVEVEVDSITYDISITGSWAVYDVGTPIDIKILTGQMQGGTAQALGYSTIEKMEFSNGKFDQRSFTDYTIPTSLDLPDTECFFIDNPYKYGPYGAKAAGELPNEGPAGAVAAAVSQAVKKIIKNIPITPEILEEKLR